MPKGMTMTINAKKKKNLQGRDGPAGSMGFSLRRSYAMVNSLGSNVSRFWAATASLTFSTATQVS